MDKDTIRYINDWILQRNEELKRMGMRHKNTMNATIASVVATAVIGGAIDLRISSGWVV